MAKDRKKEHRDFCSICGVEVTKTGYHNHRCKPEVLRAIDAANTRALREEDSPSNPRFPPRTISIRLKEGFELLSDDEIVYTNRLDYIY